MLLFILAKKILSSILKYIKGFYQNEFNLYYFTVIIIFTGLVIYFNYYHELEIKATTGNNWISRFLGQYLVYLIPFALAFFIQPIFIKNCSYFSNKWFWIILLIAPAIFAFRVHFDFHKDSIYRFFDGDEKVYAYRCISYFIRLAVTLFFIFIIWYLKDKGQMPFYGSAAMGSVKPYLLMLLIMLPLITLASTQSDFISAYPRAKFLASMEMGNKTWRWLLYEICYGFDFVTIEFFFRGFLILSLLKICGMHSIIPVAVFYCTIHLGKPMGECISSFFGGLLLGIVSYNNFSIWGGLIVHLGIAWLMEIGGWLGGVVRLRKL